MFLGWQPCTFHCNLFSFINSFIEWSNLQLSQTNGSLKSQVSLCRPKIFRLVLLTAPFSNSKLKKFLISRLMANLVSFSCDILGKLLNCPRYLHEKLSLLTHERSFQRYFKPISLLFLGQSA